MGPAYAFGMALTTGSSAADVEAWPDHIQAVSPKQVQAAARLLAETPYVFGILKPDKAQKIKKQTSMPPMSLQTGGAIR
jgi:zinc protease